MVKGRDMQACKQGPVVVVQVYQNKKLRGRSIQDRDAKGGRGQGLTQREGARVCVYASSVVDE